MNQLLLIIALLHMASAAHAQYTGVYSSVRSGTNVVTEIWRGAEPMYSSAPATYQVTTTNTTTHSTNTIILSFSAPTQVDWGDGTVETMSNTDVVTNTHTYASTGTYTVAIRQPLNVRTFITADNKATIHSANVKSMRIVRVFSLTSAKGGSFYSSDVSGWRPYEFKLQWMPSGFTGTFNSADVVNWRPDTFFLQVMPSGYAGTFNSADVANWRPSSFYQISMPTSFSGTFNSSDLTGWSPTNKFALASMSSYTGTVNSADISHWRPFSFRLYNMPAAYSNGTFKSEHIADWRPGLFYLQSMPSGYTGPFNSSDLTSWPTNATVFVQSMPASYTGTLNSADIAYWSPAAFRFLGLAGFSGTFSSSDVASWNPLSFHLYNMPTGYTHVISANSYTNFIRCNAFIMSRNGFTTNQVDTILRDLYVAAKVRTATGGSIDVSGSNQRPSGTLQACASPPVTDTTPGKEVAYELRLDSLGVITNHWTTVTTTL